MALTSKMNAFRKRTNFNNNNNTNTKNRGNYVFRGNKRRTINNNTRRRNNNNQNRNRFRITNNIQGQIDRLTNAVSKLTIGMIPKPTNLLKSNKKQTKTNKNNNINSINNRYKRKEPRYDTILTPMNMALNNRITSLYTTSNRIVKMPIYTKIAIATSITSKLYLIWYPYAVNFTRFLYNDQITVNVNDSSKPVDTLSNLIFTTLGGDFQPQGTGACGVYGCYRLIGATMKIKSPSPFNTKQGVYTIYRLNTNWGYPLLYNASGIPSQTTATLYKSVCTTLAAGPYDQVDIKNNYGSHDIAYIDEYNLTEGNTVFSGPTEYLSESYLSSEDSRAAAYPNKGNTLGNNIKYLIEFESTPGSVVDYIIETWQIVEIVPEPKQGLSSITELGDKAVSPAVLNRLKKQCPLSH